MPVKPPDARPTSNGAYGTASLGVHTIRSVPCRRLVLGQRRKYQALRRSAATWRMGHTEIRLLGRGKTTSFSRQSKHPIHGDLAAPGAETLRPLLPLLPLLFVSASLQVDTAAVNRNEKRGGVYQPSICSPKMELNQQTDVHWFRSRLCATSRKSGAPQHSGRPASLTGFPSVEHEGSSQFARRSKSKSVQAAQCQCARRCPSSEQRCKNTFRRFTSLLTHTPCSTNSG